MGDDGPVALGMYLTIPESKVEGGPIAFKDIKAETSDKYILESANAAKSLQEELKSLREEKKNLSKLDLKITATQQALNTLQSTSNANGSQSIQEVKESLKTQLENLTNEKNSRPTPETQKIEEATRQALDELESVS